MTELRALEMGPGPGLQANGHQLVVLGVQLAVIGAVSWLRPAYLGWGLLIVALGDQHLGDRRRGPGGPR